MATVHASAVLIGRRAVLIRGPSGSGKSRLVFDLIEAQSRSQLTFARLVGDDRVLLEARDGRLLVRPAPQLAGLIEIRGLGIRRLPYELVAAVGLVVDLAAADGQRLPAPETGEIVISGLVLPRLAVAEGSDALSQVLALRGSRPMAGE